MEAVPRLPMISFELKTSTEIVSFSTKLKQYISNFYHEDPESYINEIHNLETLRAAAVRPVIDVSGCQMLKKYYCQLHFLKSRFPMEDGQACAVYFSWRDNYSNMVCSVADIDFELMNILFDIGAIHSKLGAEDGRVNPEGMKLACTHFQCAAWAFQTVRKEFPQMVSLVLAPEVIQFMHLICFAQAQECILEKSMMDNRKATIIAKVVVQVVDYYKQALSTLQTADDGSLSDLLGSRTYKDWIKYVNFKIAYHKAIALLYQGEQAEEQQKMGERVAFYQAASDTLQEAYKKASNLPNQQEINEALAFTTDVIEGKRKAAKNENEFIYHEEVPDMDALQEVKGASLVKGIAFSVNDTDVSGPDIFAKLIPMEAHEASSLYSEQKANMLRQLGEAVENKDKVLVEFMSSLQLEGLCQMRQANGLTQDVVDRAAAMNARPTAIKDLIDAMAQLSNTYLDVESMLSEIDNLLKEEEQKEKDYQSQMGSRPPSIIATDLTREYTKYHEAHSKACESNQNLHKAMTTHSANLKILSLPLSQIKLQIPSIEFPNPNISEDIINEMEALLAKVDEMKKQRAMLWAQFHDAVKNDDITTRLVTCSPQFTREQLFDQELQKHRNQASLIEQNMGAQDNILKALVEAYARFTNTRRYIQDTLTKRATMLSALNNSYDTYDDLLAKANKGLEFYNKLETNVSKLLQRIKSTCKVQDEEREQILAKQKKPTITSTAPKLKDYLEAKQLETSDFKKIDNISPGPIMDSSYSVPISSGALNSIPDPTWPPAVRPTPLGSEMTTETMPSYGIEQNYYPHYSQPSNLNPIYSSYVTAATSLPTTTTFSTNTTHTYVPYDKNMEQDLNARMAALMSHKIPQSFNQIQPEYASVNQSVVIPQDNIYSAGKGTVDSSYVPSVNTSIYGGNYTYPSTNYTYDPLPSHIAADPMYDTKQNYPVSSTPHSSAVHYQPVDTYSHITPYVQAPITTPMVNYNQSQISSYDQTIHSQEQPKLPSALNYSQPNHSNYVEGPAIHSASTGTDGYVQPAVQSFPSATSSVYSQSYTNTYGPEQMSRVPHMSSYVQTTTSSYNYNADAYTVNTQKDTSFMPCAYPMKTYTEVNNMYVQPGVVLHNYVSGQNTYVNNTPNYSTNTSLTTLDQNTITYSCNTPFVTPYESHHPYSSPQLTNSYLSVYSQDSNYYYVSNEQTGKSHMNEASSESNINYQTQYTVVSTANIPYIPSVSAASQMPEVTAPSIKETSNVDLLSGLDFTINQAPLVPQPNKIENIAKEIPAAKSNEQPVPKPASKEEKECKPVLKEIIQKKQTQRCTFQDPEIVRQFSQEVDKLEKFVDILSTKTLSGPTSLELKWKEIQDRQEFEQHRKSISVARCYPMKNRFPDILPYDQTRVMLPLKRDDYINASYVKGVSTNSPEYIVTQCPLQCTFSDFWLMVCNEKVELILCMLNDTEIGHDKYWPIDQPLSLGNLLITVENRIIRAHWVDTQLLINQRDVRVYHKVRHLHFTAWPCSLFPMVPMVSGFISEILEDPTIYTKQLVLHCFAGNGRSGVICLLLSAITEILINPSSLPDLCSLAIKLSSERKNIVRDREHFKFAYQVYLYFLKDFITKNVLKKVIVDDVTVKSELLPPLNPPADPLSLLDPLWASKKGS